MAAARSPLLLALSLGVWHCAAIFLPVPAAAPPQLTLAAAPPPRCRTLLSAYEPAPRAPGEHSSELHPAQLTQRLKNAPSIKSVLELHRTSVHRYNQIHLSATWIALAKHAAGRPMPPRLLADLAPLLQHTSSMVASGGVEQRQLSNVVYGIARCGIASSDAPEVFDELATAAEAIGPGCNPQNLCNILWAFSTAGHVSPRVYSALAAAATERTEAHWRRSRDDEGFNPQSLSNTVWAVAKAGVRDPALFDALAPIAVSQMHLYLAQNLANTAWAYATAGHAAPALYEAIASTAPARLGGFTPQNIANTVWAYATAGHPAPRLLDALAASATTQIDELNGQNLANIAWAYATANHSAPRLFRAIETAAIRKASSLTPQHVANLAWAYASTGIEAPDLFDALAKAAEAQTRRSDRERRRNEKGTVVSLSMTAWAFATAGRPAPALFDAIGSEVVLRGGADLGHRSVVHTAWAFATAGHHAPELMDVLAGAGRRQVADFDTQGLANLAWAFAASGHRAPRLFDSIASELAKPHRIDDLVPQALAIVAWSFAVSGGAPRTDLFGARFVSRCEAAHFGEGALVQLHVWALWLQEEHSVPSPLSASLTARCRKAFRGQPSRPSRMQRQVASYLSELGLSPKEEVVTDQGWTIDYVVEGCGGATAAVEVDGPHHYVGETRLPTGSTQMKHRQLRTLGWKLVVVPYWEWAEAVRTTPADGGGGAAYLRARLPPELLSG